MALFQTGAIVTKISGKIGGQSFGSSKSGNYIKNVGSVINPRTQSQAQIKNRISSISQLWRTLTYSQNKSFEGKTQIYPYTNRVGQTAYYSGYNLFQKMNQGLLNIGLEPILSCPDPSVLYPPNISIKNSNSVVLEVEDQNASDSFIYQVYATPAVSSGISNPYKYFRKIANISDLELSVGVNIMPAYVAKFGKLTQGNNIFLMVLATSVINGYSTPKNNFVQTVIT